MVFERVITFTGIAAFSVVAVPAGVRLLQLFFFDEQAEKIRPLINMTEIVLKYFIIVSVYFNLFIYFYYLFLHIIQQLIQCQLCLKQVHQS